jgi:hypothetical protein
MADLGAFLASAGRTPFAFGSHDCLLWLADWAREVTGVDPAEDLRGRYRTWLGCQRFIAKRGGVEAIVAACAARVGAPRTACAKAGDAGVVQALTDRGVMPVGAICTGERWAMLAPEGLISIPARPLAAWAL